MRYLLSLFVLFLIASLPICRAGILTKSSKLAIEKVFNLNGCLHYLKVIKFLISDSDEDDLTKPYGLIAYEGADIFLKTKIEKDKTLLHVPKYDNQALNDKALPALLDTLASHNIIDKKYMLFSKDKVFKAKVQII